MLDMFKEWGRYAGLDALWGDSILVIIGVVLSSFLNQKRRGKSRFINRRKGSNPCQHLCSINTSTYTDLNLWSVIEL